MAHEPFDRCNGYTSPLDDGLATQRAPPTLNFTGATRMHFDDLSREVVCDVTKWNKVTGDHLLRPATCTNGGSFLEIQAAVGQEETQFSQWLPVIQFLEVSVNLSDLLQADAVGTELSSNPKRNEVAKRVQTLSSAAFTGGKTRANEVLLIPVLQLPQTETRQCAHALRGKRVVLQNRWVTHVTDYKTSLFSRRGRSSRAG